MKRPIINFYVFTIYGLENCGKLWCEKCMYIYTYIRITFQKAIIIHNQCQPHTQSVRKSLKILFKTWPRKNFMQELPKSTKISRRRQLWTTPISRNSWGKWILQHDVPICTCLFVTFPLGELMFVDTTVLSTGIVQIPHTLLKPSA